MERLLLVFWLMLAPKSHVPTDSHVHRQRLTCVVRYQIVEQHVLIHATALSTFGFPAIL